MGKTTRNIDDLNQSQTSIDSQSDPERENGSCNWRSQCTDIYKNCRKFLDDTKIDHKINKTIKFLISNPFLLVGLVIGITILILPILLFTTFAIINVAVTFSGFLIIEVVLIMIGMTTLICVLFFVASTVVLTGISLIVTSYITYFSFLLVKRKLTGGR